MIFKKLIIAVLWVSLFLPKISAQQKQQWSTIEKELNELLQENKVPGFSVAVVRGKELIYAKGFGYRDFEKKLPVDANTLFPIGSITKSFTAAILGQLRHEGKLDFKDSPRKYIPELKFYNNEMNNNINIVDLMAHRTGLPRHDLSWYFSQPGASRNSLVPRIEHLNPYTGVRQQWHYSNFMYMLQGVIAEQLSGKTWEANIEDYFLKPLEMTNSKSRFMAIKNASNASFGYELLQDSIISKKPYYYVQLMAPAGSIISNAKDMANWMIAWINNGKYKDKQVLPQTYVQEAMSSHAVVSAGLPSEETPDAHFSNYGYGWFLSSYKGHYRVEHGGNVLGFSLNAAFFPSDNLGIVVLCNQNISFLPALVRNTIADHLLNVNKTDWVEKSAEFKAQMAALMQRNETPTNVSAKPVHPLSDYAGDYEHPGYSTMKVEFKNDSLFLKTPFRSLYLRLKQYNAFEAMRVTENGLEPFEFWQININFSSNDKGEVTTLELNVDKSIDPVPFKRVLKEIEIDQSTLDQYVGAYDLKGTVLKLSLKNKQVLSLSIPGQPEYELVPTAKHKFAFKGLEGYQLEFIEKKGGITEVKVIQPNGTFNAKRK